MISFIKNQRLFEPKKILFYILFIAFLLRIVGINYGLPLWLIDDEPPFILGAFKMMELKTLVPALHVGQFESVLYYPPFLSYFYLAPFGIFLAMKYVIVGLNFSQFVQYIASDLSIFFLIARFLNIALGVLSAYLIYRISINIFRDELVALSSAFFLGTSLLHVSLSMTARHWLPASFIIILALFFLSNYEYNKRKRYLYSGVIIGLGIGVSTIVAPAAMLLPLWYVFYDNNSIKNLIHERDMYYVCATLVSFIIFIYILYPSSFGFSSDLTSSQSKSLSGILSSPHLFLRPVMISEPVLWLFSLLGLLYMFFRKNKISVIFLTYTIIFSWIFYLGFRFEHRFTLILFPIITLLAGYGYVHTYYNLRSYFNKILLVIILIIPLIISARFSYLASGNDTRIMARRWFEGSITKESKVLVYARLMRLSSTSNAIKEQRTIDPVSLRKVDLAEEALAGKAPQVFHALNLYTVENDGFYDNINSYAKEHSYQYMILSESDFQENSKRFEQFYNITKGGTKIASFEGASEYDYSHVGSQFFANPIGLFKIKELGPPISVYKIQ